MTVLTVFLLKQILLLVAVSTMLADAKPPGDSLASSHPTTATLGMQLCATMLASRVF